MTSIAPGSLGRDVFVIHGRNKAARRELFAFLRAIGLDPMEWDEALSRTGGGAPYIGHVLDRVIQGEHAIVILLTPDDVVHLDSQHADGEDDPELSPNGQARPNVLFEAGMAMGRCPELTVLVEFGKVRRFTDIGGRYLVRLDNSPQRRNELAQRLKAIGCAVNLDRKDWITAGDLTPPALSVNVKGEPVAEPVIAGNGPDIETRVGNHPVVFDNVHVVPNRSGRPVIYGDVHNKGPAALTLFIKGTFYGVGRKPLGSASAAVQDLASDGTMAFEAQPVDAIVDYESVLVQIESAYT